MKKTFLGLIACIAPLAMSAGVILSEEFNYPDGVLQEVSSQKWVGHSGTTNQVDVVSGKVSVTDAESQDVNAQLAGGPYNSSATLYASFVVNFSALPSSAGSYFVHFKDATTSGFRSRVFASAAGAASGKFRVGIANAAGSTPATMIASDLSLNTDYKLVMRYNMTANTSTLWIEPNSESSNVNRTDANDAGTILPITSFALRQATGIGTMTIDNILVGTAFSDVATVGGPPTISTIGDQKIAANASTGPIAFAVDDVETPAANLVVSGSSSNPTLVPNGNIVFGGSGANRTVTVTPAANQQGSATIAVVVTDGQAMSATNSFLVTVGAPTISSIAGQQTYVDSATTPIAFTVADAETPAANLVVSASSSDTALVPNGNIVIGGSGANRTLTITPASGQAGLVTISVSVSDGVHNISSSFQLTVSPNLGILKTDDFNRPDGPVVDFSGNWLTHSGAFQDMQITNNQLFVTQDRTEDVNTELAGGGPIATNSGAVLYASFKVNFSALPSLGGGYFAHFKDDGTFNFRARVFASTTNAAPGKLRLGIANSAASITSSSQVAKDLGTNETHLIVVRYNVGTGVSTLWVNPTSENDSTGVVAADLATSVAIYSFAFRQNPGIGSLFVDDLKIGGAYTDVAEVVVAPPTVLVTKSGNSVQISWPTSASGFVLESTASLTSPSWQVVSQTPVQNGDSHTVTISAPTGNRFYRLRK